jgi:hydroxypyruvate isomerase
MLWTVYRSLPFEQKLEKMAEAGYGAVELAGEFEHWTDEDFLRINRKKRSLNIEFDATGGVGVGLAYPGFLDKLRDFLPIADKLECRTVIVLSGSRIEGLPRAAQHEACIETLKRAGDMMAEHSSTLLLENIDPEEDPSVFLTSVAEGFEIVRKVDNPHVKFLCDLYHEQIAEGNLIEKLEKNIGYLNLVHVADVPGRHEPGTGEINYVNIFRKLAELKYAKYVAMEFLPSGDPVESLRAAREMAIRAVNG